MLYRMLAVVPLLGGCMAEIWAGGGVAKTPAPEPETRAAFTFGASLGVYLDPEVSRVRVGYATHIDKTYVNKDDDEYSTRNVGYSSVRADVIASSEVASDTTLTRATAIASWGASGSNTERNGMVTEAAGTPLKLFLGITRSIDDRERRNMLWSDSMSWSLGPVISRRSVDDMALWGYGAEARFTVAFSPNTVLRALGVAIDAAAKAETAPQPTSSEPSSPSTPTTQTKCTTTTTCTPIAGGGETCVPNTVCR